MEHHITHGKASLRPRRTRSKVRDVPSIGSAQNAPGVAGTLADSGSKPSVVQRSRRTLATTSTAGGSTQSRDDARSKAQSQKSRTQLQSGGSYELDGGTSSQPSSASDNPTSRSRRRARRSLAADAPVQADSAAPLVELRAAEPMQQDMRSSGASSRASLATRGGLLVLGPAGADAAAQFGKSSPSVAGSMPSSRAGSPAVPSGARQPSPATFGRKRPRRSSSPPPAQGSSSGGRGSRGSRASSQSGRAGGQLESHGFEIGRKSQASSEALAGGTGASEWSTLGSSPSGPLVGESPSKRRKQDPLATGSGAGASSRRAGYRQDQEAQWRHAMQMATAAIEGPGHRRRLRSRGTASAGTQGRQLLGRGGAELKREGGSGTPPAPISANGVVDFAVDPSTPVAQTVSVEAAAVRGQRAPARTAPSASSTTRAGRPERSGSSSSAAAGGAFAAPGQSIPGSRASSLSAGHSNLGITASRSPRRASSNQSGPMCPLPSPDTAGAVMTPSVAGSPQNTSRRFIASQGDTRSSDASRANIVALARRDSVASALGSEAPQPPASAGRRAGAAGSDSGGGTDSDASASSGPAGSGRHTTRPMPTRPMRRHLASIQQAAAESTSRATEGGDISGAGALGAFASTGGSVSAGKGSGSGAGPVECASSKSLDGTESPAVGIEQDGPPVPAGIQVSAGEAAEGDVLAGSPGVSPVPPPAGMSVRHRKLLARAQRASSRGSSVGSSASPRLPSPALGATQSQPALQTPMVGRGGSARSGGSVRATRRRRSLAVAEAAGSEVESDEEEEDFSPTHSANASRARRQSLGAAAPREGGRSGRRASSGRARGAPAARGLALAKLAATGATSGDALALAVSADRREGGLVGSSAGQTSPSQAPADSGRRQRGRLPAAPKAPTKRRPSGRDSSASRRLQELLRSGPGVPVAGGTPMDGDNTTNALQALKQQPIAVLDAASALPSDATATARSRGCSQFAAQAARAGVRLPLPAVANDLINRGHALDAAISLFRQRRQLPTFDALRPAVQSMLKTAFTRRHLQELAGLVPWHYVLYREAVSARGGVVQSVGERVEWKLCLGLGPAVDDTSVGGHTAAAPAARSDGGNVAAGASRTSSPGRSFLSTAPASSSTAPAGGSTSVPRMGMAEVATRQQERRDALLEITAAAHSAFLAASQQESKSSSSGKQGSTVKQGANRASFDPLASKGWHPAFRLESVILPLAELPPDPSVHRTQVQAQAVLANGTVSGMSPALYRSLSRDRGRRSASAGGARGTPSASPEGRREHRAGGGMGAGDPLSRARRQLFGGSGTASGRGSGRRSEGLSSSGRGSVASLEEQGNESAGGLARSPSIGAARGRSSAAGASSAAAGLRYETPPARPRPTSSRMAPPPAPVRGGRQPMPSPSSQGTGRQTPPASSPVGMLSNVRRRLDFGAAGVGAAGGAVGGSDAASDAAGVDALGRPTARAAGPSGAVAIAQGSGAGGRLANSSDSPGLSRAASVASTAGLSGLSASLLARVRRNADSAARRREEGERQRRGRAGASVDLVVLAQGVQAAFQSQRRNVLSMDTLLRTLQHGRSGQGASAEELRTGVVAVSRIVSGWLSFSGGGQRQVRRSTGVSLAAAVDQLRAHERQAQIPH